MSRSFQKNMMQDESGEYRRWINRKIKLRCRRRILQEVVQDRKYDRSMTIPIRFKDSMTKRVPK